jgi:hypothetical protein
MPPLTRDPDARARPSNGPPGQNIGRTSIEKSLVLIIVWFFIAAPAHEHTMRVLRRPMVEFVRSLDRAQSLLSPRAKRAGRKWSVRGSRLRLVKKALNRARQVRPQFNPSGLARFMVIDLSRIPTMHSIPSALQQPFG